MRITILILLSFLFSLSLMAQSPDTLVLVQEVSLMGNKVTNDKIMYREITLRSGDTLGITEFNIRKNKSRENLMNTSLFNFVEVEDSLVSNQGLSVYTVKYTVIERWYIWPLPIIELAERNLNAWWETKDFSKLNYGASLNWENFRGRREQLKVLIQFGYDEKLGFSYSIPYIDKKQTIGMSFGFNRTNNHEVSYGTVNNQVERVKLDGYAHKSYHTFFALGHRPDIHKSHSAEISYNDHLYDDTVFQINPDFYHGSGNRAQYFKLSYFYKNDHRDYRTYPLKGYYYDILIEKFGMGFFPKSAINLINAKVNLRKFWTFNRRWYFAGGFTGRIGNSENQPYFLNSGIGYGRDFVRGYEYYVVDGQVYGLIKSDLKFALIPQQVSTIKFIPTDKFNKIPWAVYLSIYSDLGYVPGSVTYGNTLQSTALWGYGVGLNLVTYYDMVFRVEYSFNQLGENGLFIHFNASI